MKFRLLIILFALVPYLTSCFSQDTAPKKYSYKFETQISNLGFDTMPELTTVSNLINVNGVQFELQSVSNDIRRPYNPIKLVFTDVLDNTNELVIQMNNFFPESKSGIVITPELSGTVNNQSSDPKLNVFTDYSNSMGSKAYLQVLETGKCKLLFRGLKVSHNLILPGNPTYRMDVVLVFQKPI